MYLQKAIFRNIAPFGNLELDFGKNQIIVFSGINGRGKTTVLSYIADAFFEIAKLAGYQDILKDNTKFYRIVSPLGISGGNNYSLVYLRFIHGDTNVDYVEVIGHLEEKEYEKAILLESKLQYSTIKMTLSNASGYKAIYGINQNIAKEIFNKNILAYFPFDRLEIPAWLNEIEYKNNRFNTKARFDGQLNKNIEVRTVSDQIVNWILDVVLDFTITSSVGYSYAVTYTDSYSKSLYDALNILMQKILSSKVDACRLGINKRKSGPSRISIVKDVNGKIETISPSIFHLSSGEIALLVLFSEIIRQYDINSINNQFNFEDIIGIVVIDEVDKHLHMILLKETLPELFKLFPNVQFIVSSHSPFFALGATEKINERTRFLDLTINGKDIPVMKIEELGDIYNHILNDNKNYRKLYDKLESDVARSKKLRILTEGHNIKYVEKAIQIYIPDLLAEIFICTGIEDRSGKNQLIQLYEMFLKTNAFEKTLFIWDCDVKEEVKGLGENESVYKCIFDKNEKNTKVTKGIENLFDENLFEKKYYPEQHAHDNYGAKRIIEEFDKKAFQEDMIANATKETFVNYTCLIEKIKTILKK